MSFVPDLFGGGAATIKSEPVVTRDAAADEVAADNERKRKALLAMGGGYAGTMLSGPGGVSSELTGTRSLGS